MSLTISKYHMIDEVPDMWDQLSVSYFQKKVFLSYLEKYNPCYQRYYLGYRGDQLMACAVVYSINIDLFTFADIKSPLTMQVVGIPCSISYPGIFGHHQDMEFLKENIHKSERGLCLLLNLERPFMRSKYLSGPTLPTVIIPNTFGTWAGYLSALRAPYRRRIKSIKRTEGEINISMARCSSFTAEMYGQYLQVFTRSKAKLEKLSFPFFQHLPDPFTLITCFHLNRLLGWVIVFPSAETYCFFIGGVDYKLNHIYSTYFRLLIAIVQQGIAFGAKYIDLGQTAEIPKMRMAGQLVHRYLEAGHSVGVFNKLLKFSKRLLVYYRSIPEAHVLKTAS